MRVGEEDKSQTPFSPRSPHASCSSRAPAPSPSLSMPDLHLQFSTDGRDPHLFTWWHLHVSPAPRPWLQLAASLFCLMWPWLPDGMHRACMQLASDTPLSSFHGGRRRLCSSETTTTTCRRSNRCERQEKTMDTTQGFCCASVHVNASHIYGMDMLAIFPCQYVYSWILASWREYELHLGMTLA